jgi:hypothetical protein
MLFIQTSAISNFFNSLLRSNGYYCLNPETKLSKVLTKELRIYRRTPQKRDTMFRHTSLLFLSSLLSASFPSIGWTQVCFSDRPTCAVRCPILEGVDTVQITCKEHSTYYACNDGHSSLPALSQCTCPSNLEVVTNVIYNKESLNLVNLPLPAIEVTCIASNRAVSPSSPVIQTLPKGSSLTQPPPSVYPSTPPSALHNPSVSPPINAPQAISPSNNESVLNVVPSHKPTSDSTPMSSNPVSPNLDLLPSRHGSPKVRNLLKWNEKDDVKE